MEGNKNITICNYCGLMIKSGGITGFKFNLSRTDPYSNTKKCPNVAKKAAYMKEIRVELRGTMGGRYHTIIDDEGEADEDVYIYPADIHPDERDKYRETVRTSKASE